MAHPTILSKLRGLVLSAQELKTMTDWPDALVEDYLNLIDNLILLADEVDTKNNIIKNTTIVTSSPYVPSSEDEELFINTDAIPIIITLPAGIDGTNYRMINIGSSGNDVTLIPNGIEKLFGENTTERIADSEVLIMTFETNEGWH